MPDLTPYATAQPFFGPLDTWLKEDDAKRIAAYQLYEAIYRNVPDAFKIVQRGSDANPIYIPSAKTLVEAKNRYLAKRWTYALDPKLGSDAERVALDTALTVLFRRETMYSKFGTQKRYGLIRGDAVWHIVANPAKPEGRRISLYEVDPAAYFPIDDPFNPDKILGCHLAEPVEVKEGGPTVIKRQTYRKQENGTITYEMTYWEVGAWDDREPSPQELKPAKEVPQSDPAVRETALPPTITSIPVYHVKNSRVPNAPFGVSELEGMERIIGGINQGISDEELTLALMGLGLYATTSGPPVDEAGKETNWNIGPGWVVEIDENSDFKKVTGVSTVTPMQEHLAYLEAKMREASGVPDIAIGNVDVQTAESGIALAFKMAPILAGNEEKEQEILSVMDHLLYDLAAMWMPAYEGFTPTVAQAVSVVDDPMPVNRDAIIKEVTALVTAQIISLEYARQILSEKLGYEFPETMGEQIVDEQAALTDALNSDPFASRIATELATLNGASV